MQAAWISDWWLGEVNVTETVSGPALPIVSVKPFCGLLDTKDAAPARQETVATPP